MPTLTLATFNTHYGLRPARRPPAVPYDMHAALEALDADVIVLQEVYRPDRHHGPVDAAAASLGLTVWYQPTGPATTDTRWPHLAPDGAGESGIAVLSRLPIRRVGALVLGPTYLDPAPGRTALDVAVDVDGATLRVIAVHLTSRLPHGPPIQLRRLARLLPPAGTPAVVAGDHNFWGPGVVGLMRGWHRSARGRTWPTRWPHSQIDHVLLRPADVEVLDARVLPDLGSDHLPVRVELGFGAGDGSPAPR